MRPAIQGLGRLGALAAILALGGCSGSSTSLASGPGDPLPPGSYTVSLALDAPADLRVPVSGISTIVALPPGVVVSTSGAGSERIAPEALSSGSALGGPSMVSGKFATGTREATLAVATVPPGRWSGEFARLRVVVPSGASVSRTDLEASPVRTVKSVGVDDDSRATVALTDRTWATIRLAAP